MIAMPEIPTTTRKFGIIDVLEYEWPRGATNTRGRGTGRQVPMRVNSNRPLFKIGYHRKSLTRREKSTIWTFSYGRCWYCGFMTNPFRDFCIDHVVPLARGGDNSLENLVPACTWCNSRKGTKLIEEWREGFWDPYEDEEPFTNDLGLFAFERSGETHAFDFQFSKSMEILNFREGIE